MKRLLNTLYVTSPGTYLSRKGESVLVRVENETKLCVPIHTLDGIICFGQVMCSPPLLGLCAEQQVTVSFLSDYGRFYARVQGPVSGNILLRREQYRKADKEDFAAELARSFVIAKIANCRTSLLRAARACPGRVGDQPETQAEQQLKTAIASLATILKELKQPTTLDSVRGQEGMAAKVYFGVFDRLITVEDKALAFQERSRRPPLNNMNALLSFLYTLLTHDVSSAAEAVGLDPAVGFLHRDRPGRPGLALDMMEEFRPFFADRLALSLVNRKQLQKRDFTKSESGAVRMTDEARKKLLVAYQKRKQEVIIHPFLGEKISVGLLPHVQMMLLARRFRGDLDGYPPFIWK